jgi:hypothetical protein
VAQNLAAKIKQIMKTEFSNRLGANKRLLKVRLRKLRTLAPKLQRRCTGNAVNRQLSTVNKESLPDTKLTEDPGELFFIGDFTGDFPEIVETASDIQSKEIAR